MADLSFAFGPLSFLVLCRIFEFANSIEFRLGDLSRTDGRSVNKRFKLIQSDMLGILAGLARATERYASDIVRGDTSIFPKVIKVYAQKLRSRS